MANYVTLLSLSLSFLLVLHGCHGNRCDIQQQEEQEECENIERISALVPIKRVQSEAGWTDLFDSNNQLLKCAGVEVMIHRIQPRGLLLPYYTNANLMLYIQQGSGYLGVVLPGCPETFQSSQQVMQQNGSFPDSYQRTRRFREGDFVALPVGVAHWILNDGPKNKHEDIVVVALNDVNNLATQLDRFHRRFFLAGNPQGGQQKGSPKAQQSPDVEVVRSVLTGLGADILADAFNVGQDVARLLQDVNYFRGTIVMVEDGIVINPSPISQEEDQQGLANGTDMNLCSAIIISNIDDPSSADVYNPDAGWSKVINSLKLPILQMMQLSAQRGVLYKNAMVSPYWTTNADSILYVTNGNMRMQIVNDRGDPVFDQQINEGQVLVIPENYVTVKQAGEDGCQFIEFNVNANANVNSLAGSNSVIRALPLGVVQSAYRMSTDQASNLKYNRNETMIFIPSSRSTAAP